MRIALLTHVFYPDPAGGVGRYVAGVTRAMRRRGHSVSLLTTHSSMRGPRKGARIEDASWEDVPVRRLTFNLGLAPQPYRYEWDNPWVNKRILEFVRERGIEVVHFVHGGRLSMSSVPLLKAAGVAVVGQMHDYWFICALSNLRRVHGALCEGPDLLAGECIRCVVARPWTDQDPVSTLVAGAPNAALKGLALAARALPNPPGRLGSAKAQTERLGDMQRYLAAMDVLLCPTRFAAGLLRRNGFSEHNVRVLPLGIELASSPPWSPRAEATLRVGFLGRLEPMKGVHVLVEAVRSLPRDLPIEVWLFGNEEVPAYVQRLRAVCDERIRFCGEVPSAEEALPRLDVLVLPSLVYECYPLVIREANAFGVPAIVSDIGGMKEAVRDGVDGLHFRVGDAVSLARQLRRLLDEPNLLPRLRANIQPPLTIEQHADALEGVYQEVRPQASAPAVPPDRLGLLAR